MMRPITALIMFAILAVLYSCEKKQLQKEPVADFTVSPASGSFLTVFNFDASTSIVGSEDGGILQAQWDWEGDGIFDTEFSTILVKNHKYSEPGNYNVVLQVKNELGWSDSESAIVVVYADSVPPLASFTVVPDTASVNTIFFFNSASTYDQYTPIEEMRFRWDWEADGVWDTPPTYDTCIYHRFSVEGLYRVRLEAINKYQISDTTSTLIYVYDI
ncbi:MAG: PKD domain-containing protein [Bacteroidales bacterium]|nr:PKD domain-containing protein [Bacteroidales bacterium]